MNEYIIAKNLTKKTAEWLEHQLRKEFPEEIIDMTDTRGNDGAEGEYTCVLYVDYLCVDLEDMRRYARAYLAGIYDRTHRNLDWVGDVPKGDL